MYFALTRNPNNLLPFQRKLGDFFLTTMDDSNYYGYQLGQYGGNYVEIKSDSINFSFHKDFKLYCNDEIIATNLFVTNNILPSDIVAINKAGIFNRYDFETHGELPYNIILNRVYELLLENIKTCAKLSQPKIVYTAGLDSGTLAFIAHSLNIDFTCLIDSRFESKFKNLPFKNIRYVDFQTSPDFEVTFGPKTNIKEGFYQAENNMLITGYYGDNTVVHNTDMFNQARQLHSCPDKIILYDKKPANEYIGFSNKQDIIESIKYINTQNYFRHWFEKFQILDPYRDPRIFTTITRLDTDSLIEQIGSAKIQKDIIASLDPNWLELLCDYKNDYSKF